MFLVDINACVAGYQAGGEGTDRGQTPNRHDERSRPQIGDI